jgi:hypothetical protein
MIRIKLDRICRFVHTNIMKPVYPFRASIRGIRPLLICTFALLMAHTTQAESLNKLHQGLPKQLSCWSAEPKDHIYDDKTIFRYINGAAEVYKAYNMKQCLSRRYVIDDGPDIVLDIFDMTTPEDAFGVFTHDTDGKPIRIGQAGRIRPGWLSFWKHRFFVSIYTEEETEAAEKAVLVLGKKVASLIQKKGSKPTIVSRLPNGGLQTDNIRYLHHPIILNYHFYIADENILNLTDQTDAALATYHKDKETALLLLVVYPGRNAAAESLTRFLKSYLPDAGDTGTAQLENKKWAAAAVKGPLLGVVLESDSRKLAESLIEAIRQQ